MAGSHEVRGSSPLSSTNMKLSCRYYGGFFYVKNKLCRVSSLFLPDLESFKYCLPPIEHPAGNMVEFPYIDH